MAITVHQFVVEAVKDGISSAPALMMQQLEESLKKDVLVQESGSAEGYLQNLINETEAEILEDEKK